MPIDRRGMNDPGPGHNPAQGDAAPRAEGPAPLGPNLVGAVRDGARPADAEPPRRPAPLEAENVFIGAPPQRVDVGDGHRHRPPEPARAEAFRALNHLDHAAENVFHRGAPPRQLMDFGQVHPARPPEPARAEAIRAFNHLDLAVENVFIRGARPRQLVDFGQVHPARPPEPARDEALGARLAANLAGMARPINLAAAQLDGARILAVPQMRALHGMGRLPQFADLPLLIEEGEFLPGFLRPRARVDAADGADLASLSMLPRGMAEADAPAPFGQISALNLELHTSQRGSIAKQMRFFAAMEGPAQPFTLQPSNFSAPRHFVPAADGQLAPADMKSFVRDALAEQPHLLFTLSLHDGLTELQVHGEHNPQIGKFLYTLSGEVRAALALAYARGQESGDHQTLRNLFGAIGNWCLDGSVNALNQFLQESALGGVDLSLVPNMDQKHDLPSRAAEWARVFGLHQARQFAKETGEVASTTAGDYAPGYEANYFNAKKFMAFLASHESASMLSDSERVAIVAHAEQNLALFA